MSFDKVGDVQEAQGDLAGALKSYNDSLVIRDRLAKSDPGNAGWQRDLSVSHSRLASALGKAGKKLEACEALNQGRAIMLYYSSQASRRTMPSGSATSFGSTRRSRIYRGKFGEQTLRVVPRLPSQCSVGFARALVPNRRYLAHGRAISSAEKVA